MTYPYPGAPAPDGAWRLGDGQKMGQNVDPNAVAGIVTNGAKTSFVNAQNALNANVKVPLAQNATQINSQSNTLSNHENRIVKLEDGTLISSFYNNDTFHKPTGYNWHTVHTIGGGAGGYGGQHYGGSAGGQGAGRGGWDTEVYADADLTASSYAVIIGTSGLGSLAYYLDQFQRSNGGLGFDWRTESGTSAPQLVSAQVEVATQTADSSRNGSWASFNEIPTVDNVAVRAEIVNPTTAQALDNVSGVFLAGADTVASTSVMVTFVGTPSGCWIMTQQGAVAAPYAATGSQAGQAAVASSTTGFVAGKMIELRRQGSTFIGYVDNVEACRWVDSGNTVPTGVGNRRCGIIAEGNYPVFQNEYRSFGIAEFQVIQLDATKGGNTIFSGTGITQTGGGGYPGAVFGASSPAAMGSGNTTTPVDGGGLGGASDLTGVTAGGDGTDCTGGTSGVSAGSPGHDGGNVPTGKMGVGAAGGGGQGNASGDGGQGGSGGFPGGPGGGGGGCLAGNSPGGGGNGSPGALYIISSMTHP